MRKNKEAELIEINRETGNEESLLCTGSWEEMVEIMEDSIQEAEDAGHDHPTLMIQWAA